jgi:predicted site-specific integrase-resolvase
MLLHLGVYLSFLIEATPIGSAGLYARVSSLDQKNDLDGQLGRLVTHAAAQGWDVRKTVGEVGSRLKGESTEADEAFK